MDEKEWLNGPQYARNLGYSDAQYEEAMKRIKTTKIDVNQLLMALIDVSDRKNDGSCELGSETTGSTELLSSTSSTSINRSFASTSCYSNTTSSEQSLDNVQFSQTSLRKVYIDGSNIAKTHGKDRNFSWIGIKICVDWFSAKGHKVKVFVPAPKCSQADSSIVRHLKDLNALIETPSGCNDDLIIIEAARHHNALIVSNDLYRDEKRFNEELKSFIHNNRLPYVFVDDDFIPVPDPLGRSGPTLYELLGHVDTVGNSCHRQRHTINYKQTMGPSLRQPIRKSISVVDYTRQSRAKEAKEPQSFIGRRGAVYGRPKTRFNQ